MPDGGHEGAVPLEVRPDAAGRMWVNVDSLVDLFADMGKNMTAGPAKSILDTLAASFRRMSTYAEMEDAAGDDGSAIVARHCATCRTAVIDARRVSGAEIVIDAEPVADGPFFPMKVTAGVPLLAPYSNSLEGTVGPRLREHVCVGQS